ncbi:MAG: DUF5317 family protein [Acidimicrobiia bacterium]
MLAYVIAIALAVAVIPITDGSFRRLADVAFSRPWLLAVGLVLQVGLSVVDIPKARLEDVGVALLLLSYVAVLAFVASNVGTRGFILIGVGIALNAGVIALNLGMPYRVVDGIPRETTIKHRPERSTDVLPILSDRMAFGSPLYAALSIGDLLLFAGFVEFAYANSRRPRRRGGRKHFVDLPALEATQHDEAEVDLRGDQPVATREAVEDGAVRTRSRASRTRGS